MQTERPSPARPHGPAALVGLALMAATVALPGNVQAIPTFSRLYSTECKTCHSIVPERNEFGEAFAKNGFVWPGKQSATPKPPPSPPPSGATNSKALFVSDIPTQVPVSFLGKIEASHNPDNTPKTDLFSKGEFEIFTAGAFRHVASWWAGFAVEKEGNEDTETALEELYVKFRTPLAAPLFIKAGRFSPTLSLWKKNDRASSEKLAFVGQQVGVGHGLPGMNDSEAEDWREGIGDRQFALEGQKNGIELSKVFATRAYGALGVLNSENGNSNEVYAHLSARLLGTDFLGKEPEVDLDADSLADFLTVTVGGYAYRGTWLSPIPLGGIITAPFDNTFTRTGLEGDIRHRALRVRLGMGWGKDDNLYGDDQARDSRHHLIQAQYQISSQLMVGARYESLSEELADGTEATTAIYGPAVTYAMLENLLLSAEYLYSNLPGDSADQETMIHLLFAF